jgi:hypothetical protein
MTPANAQKTPAVLGVPGTQSTPRSTADVFLMTLGDTTPVADGNPMSLDEEPDVLGS